MLTHFLPVFLLLKINKSTEFTKWPVFSSFKLSFHGLTHLNCLPPSSSQLVLSLASSLNQRKFPLPLFVPRKLLQHARPCWTACNLKRCHFYANARQLKFPTATKFCAWESPTCCSQKDFIHPHSGDLEQTPTMLMLSRSLSVCYNMDMGGSICTPGTYHVLQVLNNNSVLISWLRQLPEQVSATLA